MPAPFVPTPQHRSNHNYLKARLEYAGYKIEIHEDSVVLKRPTGQILKHYKKLGNALRGGEIDIRKFREFIKTPKTTAQKYWEKVLKKFDESGTFEWWAKWYTQRNNLNDNNESTHPTQN